MYHRHQLDTETAFRRYEEIRARLPEAAFPAAARDAETLADVIDGYDGFVLDAYGVLNVGETAIEGAVERIAAMRAAGKRLVVLTNAASYTVAKAVARFAGLGFDFSVEEIVSSRAVTARHLPPETRWAGISAPGDDFADLPAPVADLLEEEALFETAEGFLFLSTARWTADLQERLVAALRSRPRPVVIANPDLVAPRASGLSIEPGFWGHDIRDRTEVRPVFFGKPFENAFDVVRSRLGGGRIAMVGDTLHTDILGGRAAGFDTVLVTDHGLFAGADIAAYIARAAIMPDVIVRTT